MVDFADGSTYNIQPKFLSLVEEVDAVTGTTSEHRQVDKRAKIRTPSKEKEDAAEEESEGEDERSDSDYAEEEGQEGEGGEEEHRHARERAKTRSPSKRKTRATPKGKKRAAPEGARTSQAAKAAKKQKTSASACQVRRERNYGRCERHAHGLLQPAQRNSQHLTWLRMIRTGGIVSEKDFGV